MRLVFHPRNRIKNIVLKIARFLNRKSAFFMSFSRRSILVKDWTVDCFRRNLTNHKQLFTYQKHKFPEEKQNNPLSTAIEHNLTGFLHFFVYLFFLHANNFFPVASVKYRLRFLKKECPPRNLFSLLKYRSNLDGRYECVPTYERTRGFREPLTRWHRNPQQQLTFHF